MTEIAQQHYKAIERSDPFSPFDHVLLGAILALTVNTLISSWGFPTYFATAWQIPIYSYVTYKIFRHAQRVSNARQAALEEHQQNQTELIYAKVRSELTGFPMPSKPLTIERLDHLVLTVKDIDATCAFYKQVLGMEEVTFGDNRKALLFGSQKINLHQQGHEFEPKANQPTPGSEDLCFICAEPIEKVMQHLQVCGVAAVQGPVSCTGALGAMTSVYFRDPDLNLIEISNYAVTAS